MDVRAAVAEARTAASDGGSTITPGEAASILTRARGEGIDERRLRSALGRAYEAPLATAIGASTGVGTVGLSAGETHVRLSTVLTGSAGVVNVSFDVTAGASDRLLEMSFARLVGQMYGLEPGRVTPELLASPALSGLHDEFMAAARAGGDHNFHFPPALTAPPAAS